MKPSLSFFLVFSSVFIAFSGSAHAGAAWPTYQTFLETGELVFDKPIDSNVLILTQTESWNPFQNSTISNCFGNGCSYPYLVDGGWFAPGHPLWQYADANGVPQQSWVRKRDWASNAYKFDNVKPYCSTARVSTADGQIYVPYTTGWTNQNVFAKSLCFDAHSGCKVPESEPINITSIETEQIITSFSDNVGNKVIDCVVPVKGKKNGVPNTPGGILVDQSDPGFDSIALYDDTGDNFFTQKGMSGPLNVSTKAGLLSGKIVVSDEKTGNFGISGIKSVQVSFQKTANYLGNPISGERIDCLNKTDFPSVNPYGDIVTPDIQSVDFTCSNTSGIQKTGVYDLVFALADYAGNTSTVRKSLTVLPSNVDPSKSSIAFDTSTSLPADSIATNPLKISLKDAFDNAIINKDINLSDVSGKGGIFLNTVNKTGASATIFKDVTTSKDGNWKMKTNNLGIAEVLVASYAPGILNADKFDITIKNWNDTTSSNMQLLNGAIKTASFDKLYKIDMKLTTGNTIKLSSPQNYTIFVTKSATGSINPAYTLSHIAESLIAEDSENLQVSYVSAPTDASSNPKFDLSIELIGSSVPKNKNISVLPHISYSINGNLVTYTLDSKYGDNSTVEKVIIEEGSKIESIRIVGNMQGSNSASQQILGYTNVSEIKGAEIRSLLKKGITMATRNMTNGQIINGIKYIEGDATLNSYSDVGAGVETVVVHNGNLTIRGDIIATNKLALVSFADNTTDYKKGNIYIDKSVGYIEAILVADGGVITTGWLSGSDRIDTNYTVSAVRTEALSKQLVIKGSLITNNTIGGSIKGKNAEYLLPRGEVTSSFNLATAFDLNYLRTGNEESDASRNMGYTENTIIIYNPEILKDPPKGLTIK